MNPVTLVRQRALAASGFDDASGLADAVLSLVSQIGQDLLKGDSLARSPLKLN